MSVLLDVVFVVRERLLMALVLLQGWYEQVAIRPVLGHLPGVQKSGSEGQVAAPQSPARSNDGVPYTSVTKIADQDGPSEGRLTLSTEPQMAGQASQN